MSNVATNRCVECGTRFSGATEVCCSEQSVRVFKTRKAKLTKKFEDFEINGYCSACCPRHQTKEPISPTKVYVVLEGAPTDGFASVRFVTNVYRTAVKLARIKGLVRANPKECGPNTVAMWNRNSVDRVWIEVHQIKELS